MNLKQYKIRTQRDLENFNRIILWGAGGYAAESIETFGDKVTAIFDNDSTKWGQTISGIKVLNPHLDLLKYVAPTTAVVLSTSAYQRDIAIELTQVYKIPEDQIFSLCPDYQEERMYNPQQILDHTDLIMQVESLLEDEASKEYFSNALAARLTHNPLYIRPNPRMKGADFYDAGILQICPKKGDSILDCGAFIGDTAQLFWEMIHQEGMIYCFEPFEGNYQKLVEWIRQEQLEEHIKPYQIALSDKKEVRMISAQMNTSPRANIRADETIENQIAVDCIDNLMDTFEHIHFIKMDIEGEEINALHGAVKALQHFHPQMMISAYHKTSHLWEIPLLIKNIVPQYKIYMGHHPNVAFEPEFYFSL